MLVPVIARHDHCAGRQQTVTDSHRWAGGARSLHGRCRHLGPPGRARANTPSATRSRRDGAGVHSGPTRSARAVPRPKRPFPQNGARSSPHTRPTRTRLAGRPGSALSESTRGRRPPPGSRTFTCCGRAVTPSSASSAARSAPAPPPPAATRTAGGPAGSSWRRCTVPGARWNLNKNLEGWMSVGGLGARGRKARARDGAGPLRSVVRFPAEKWLARAPAIVSCRGRRRGSVCV